MRSPADMRLLLIDITNACVYRCSNCTRFCGTHKKTFFMDEETFKRAVDAYDGFGKTVGIIGGEPTLHPKFETFTRYIAQKYPPRHKIKPCIAPTPNFPAYIRDKNFFWDEAINERKGPGLLTAVCSKYYDHFELIQDSYSWQSVNDHMIPSKHQPLLVSRKDMGITDSEWVVLRDNCWFQNNWSATVTPKGAFFCEIAATIDLLFDGPGGWPIEKGWWKRKPEDFGYQLELCELCGGALFKKGRWSSDEMYDISKTLYEKLEGVDSPILRNGRIEILESVEGYQTNVQLSDSINRYLIEPDKRISKTNKALYAKYLDKFTVKPDNFGRALVRDVTHSHNDWILLYYDGCHPVNTLLENLDTTVINPGVLYIHKRNSSTALLFNAKAAAIKNAGLDSIGWLVNMDDFINLWPEGKRYDITGYAPPTVNPDLSYWVNYAKENNLHTDIVHKALNKIASDYGANSVF